MNKWPKVVNKVEFNRLDLINHLTSFVINKNPATIQKRAYICLG
jgi:hypothetical protein